jgi:acyl-CoA:acyl-CoA alkyltransferase
LRPALTRLELRADLLEEVAGVRERRIWDGPMPVASAAVPAGRKALDPAAIGSHRFLGGVTRPR